MERLFTEDAIFIHANAESVWKVLTESEYTIQYMYTCRLECSWELNSPMLWVGNFDNVLYVKGALLDLKPHSYLKFSVFDPNAVYADIPENYLQVEYVLKPFEEGCSLTVKQGDYNAVAEGASRYKHSMDTGGYAPILKKIKELAEEF